MDGTNISNILSRKQSQVSSSCSFFNHRYFSVIVDDQNQDEQRNQLDILIAASIDEAEERDERYQTTLNKVRNTMSLVTKTPWLRHTRWEEIFVEKDMKELNKLVDPPGQRDYDECKLWDSVTRVLNGCFNGFLDCQKRGWSLIPFWLSSVDRNKENTKPFRSYIAPYTLRRYIGYWQRYLLFCMRAIMTEEAVQFTPQQSDCLLELISIIHQNEDHENIDKKVLELSVLLIKHSDYASQQSSLIYFSGVLGYNVDWKQWRQPHDYTTILAGLQFCIRVIILQSALPLEERTHFSQDSEMNPVAVFRSMRDIWLIDGEGTILFIIY